MNYIVPLASLIIVAAVTVAAFLILRSDKERTISAYDRLLERRDAEYEILADRMFLKERVPPSGVNLTEAHQERVEQVRLREAERRLRGPQDVATGIGPVDRAQGNMLRDYRRRHPISVPDAPASEALEQQIHTRQNTGAVA